MTLASICPGKMEATEDLVSKTRLRFDAPNKKLFRDFRNGCVADFKATKFSRGRDHWDLKKWRTQVRAYMEEQGIGPVVERNISCMVLLLRSTIIKR
jgi:hypothetical protein